MRDSLSFEVLVSVARQHPHSLAIVSIAHVLRIGRMAFGCHWPLANLVLGGKAPGQLRVETMMEGTHNAVIAG
jgi:hypothetical protein